MFIQSRSLGGGGGDWQESVALKKKKSVWSWGAEVDWGSEMLGPKARLTSPAKAGPDHQTSGKGAPLKVG